MINLDIPPTLSLAIAGWQKKEKTFCNASRRDKRGYVVAECTFHAGHENDHRDVHTGATWV